MKRLAKILAGLSLLSILNYVRINSEMRLPLYLYRLIVQALSPLLMLLGIIATIIGWREKSRNVIVSGMIGSILAGFYIQQATQHHDGFERAFGIGWQNEIDVAQRKYMLGSRFQVLLPVVPEPLIQRDIVYATVDGQELTCDILQPPAHIKPSGVALIFCHGSGWFYGNKAFSTNRLFKHLAAQGHVCMNINYRKLYETDAFGLIGDLHRAVAWLKQHADDYGVNPDRIVVSGASAGGHMAMLVAYASDHPQLKPSDITTDTSVRGVISFYGVTDIRAFYEDNIARFSINRTSSYSQLAINILHKLAPIVDKESLPLLPQEMIRLLLDGTPDEKPDLCNLLSPINHVHENCPPTLLLNGEYDLGIAPQHIGSLANALREQDCTVIHNELPYTDHGFDLLFTAFNPAFRTALFDVERFMALMQ